MTIYANDIIPIVIINWNGIDDTIECIDSVLKTKSIKYHIWLIDNNSDNTEGKRLKELYNSNELITVKCYSTNLGFAKAHNKIWVDELKDSNSKYIALLNNDTVVESQWLSAMIDTAEKHNCDIVASKMINYYDRTRMDNAGHRMLNTGEIIPIAHNTDPKDFTEEFENLGACGGGALYSTDMLNKIGFFDPYFSTGYEDAELGLRALVSGYKSVFCPNAIVFHKMGQSISKVFNEQYSLMIHKAILYSYFKCMPTLNIISTLPSFIFKYLAMIIIDLIFWRPTYLRILIESWKCVFKNEGNWIRVRKEVDRKMFYFRHSKLISFLWFDISRFWNLIIKKQKSAIDQY